MLGDVFPNSLHLRLIDAGGAADSTVWQLAREHECVLVTKDEDFSSPERSSRSASQSRVASPWQLRHGRHRSIVEGSRGRHPAVRSPRRRDVSRARVGTSVSPGAGFAHRPQARLRAIQAAAICPPEPDGAVRRRSSAGRSPGSAPSVLPRSRPASTPRCVCRRGAGDRPCPRTGGYGALQTKFAASSVLPDPLYDATCGYGHSGRVRSTRPWVECDAMM